MNKTIYIAEEDNQLWTIAARIAAMENKPLSQVIIELLREYVRGYNDIGTT